MRPHFTVSFQYLTQLQTRPTYSSALALQHSSTYAPPPPKRSTKGVEMSESATLRPQHPTVFPHACTGRPFPIGTKSTMRTRHSSSLFRFRARAHNLWNFMELNRELNRVVRIKLSPKGFVSWVYSHTLARPQLLRTRPVPDRTLIDPTSSTGEQLIGESTKVGERSSVKRSVIGKHCTIGKNVVIANSVILDHCVIDDRLDQSFADCTRIAEQDDDSGRS